MLIARVEIENFRCLHCLDLPLSPFSCVVGHNNAGKSTVLTALSLFVHGSKIGPADFYDPKEEVAIRVTLEGVTADDLVSLTPDHRERVAELIVGGRITLIRRYDTDGASSLRCVRPVTREVRFRDDEIKAKLAAKRGAAALRAATLEAFPKLDGQLDGLTSKEAFVAAIERLRAALPGDQFEEQEAALPTGIDNSVTKLLPGPILIPAVKNVADEVKTKEAASFGKILKIMLESIAEAERMQAVNDSFAAIKVLLNIDRNTDGTAADGRLEEIRTLEQKVNGYVRGQFPDVQLQLDIPPPELKTVVGNARILLYDGVWGQVETKGDGMKRAVTFALHRSIADMKKVRAAAGAKAGQGGTRQRYLFLFEEPELYLHLQTQRVLYDALVDISTEHQVCVSTHSPFFFAPKGTGTFIRLGKAVGVTGEEPPTSHARCVDLLSNISCRDAFQLICYENSAAAFFCDRVVLVEGDSDLLYLKHVAKTMDAAWDFDGRNIAVVRINGNGNFKRYREFFSHFGVRVDLITDLDSLVD